MAFFTYMSFVFGSIGTHVCVIKMESRRRSGLRFGPPERSPEGEETDSNNRREVGVALKQKQKEKKA